MIDKVALQRAVKLRPKAQAILDLAEYFRKYRWKDGRKTKITFCQFDMFQTYFEPAIERLFSWEIEEEDVLRIAMLDAVVKRLPSCHNCPCGWELERPILEDYYWDMYDAHYDIERCLKEKRREFQVLKKKPEFHSFLLSQIKKQNFLCYYCKGNLSNTYHVDHRLPLSKGGSNKKANLVVACAKCNLKKNAYIDEDFSLDPEYVNWVSLQFKEGVWMPVLTN